MSSKFFFNLYCKHNYCLWLQLQFVPIGIFECVMPVLSLRWLLEERTAWRAVCARSHWPVHCFRLVVEPPPAPKGLIRTAKGVWSPKMRYLVYSSILPEYAWATTGPFRPFKFHLDSRTHVLWDETQFSHLSTVWLLINYMYFSNYCCLEKSKCIYVRIDDGITGFFPPCHLKWNINQK